MPCAVVPFPKNLYPYLIEPRCFRSWQRRVKTYLAADAGILQDEGGDRTFPLAHTPSQLPVLWRCGHFDSSRIHSLVPYAGEAWHPRMAISLQEKPETARLRKDIEHPLGYFHSPTMLRHEATMGFHACSLESRLRQIGLGRFRHTSFVGHRLQALQASMPMPERSTHPFERSRSSAKDQDGGAHLPGVCSSERGIRRSLSRQRLPGTLSTEFPGACLMHPRIPKIARGFPARQ